MLNRLLITGGSGYLGRHLARLVAAEWPGDFLYTTFSADPLGLPQGATLDLRDGPAVTRLVSDFAPDAVIHTAGSNRTPDMVAVIVEGTRHVVEAAKGARLIHLSTDSIFDGGRAPYDETARPAPLNDYGWAKAEAETIVREHPNAVIVRTSLIYGLKEMDNGTAWMAEALQAGRPVTLFSNQRRNPVWVETLSRACLELIDLPHRGVLNVAGRQVMTRAAFGLRLLDWWGVAERESLTVVEDTSGKWPLDCEMDVGLAARLLRTPLLGVDEVMTAGERGSRGEIARV
jgi:dTDP-4-dehydrorhamnose reductase